MMRTLKILILVLAIALASSCQKNERSKEFDCVYSSGSLCVIPFEKLLSDRRLFDGKMISVSGVISVEGSEIYLYPDIDSKRYEIHEKSVLIKPGAKYLGDIEHLDGKYCGVTGHAVFENGNYWMKLILTNNVQQLPVVVDKFPPAPPKPESL